MNALIKYKAAKKLLRIIKNKTIRLFIPSKIHLKIMYYVRLQKKIDFRNLQSFNEKLQWLKLYDRNPDHTIMADKYEVRKYITDKIGEQYLIPLIGVWDTFQEIDFEKLPNQFVLKCTHDSGGLVICKDKSQFNQEAAKEKINSSLKRNYFYHAREWPYKNIKPRIVCEKLIVDESSDDLKDYKFMCFNGRVKCIFVCSNRNSPKGLNADFYDTQWKHMPFERYYKNSGVIIPKPQNFQQMFEISEFLSSNETFLRVDFYEVNGKVYLGELTLFPGSGFEPFTPESYDYLLGSWMELPEK